MQHSGISGNDTLRSYSTYSDPAFGKLANKLTKESMGGSAIQASSSLLAMATAHRCPQRSPVIRRSVASTGFPNF